MTEAPRWDTDGRGHGVSGAPDLAPDARRLADALDGPDWIAEEPEVHLLPHIERACAVSHSRARMTGWSIDVDGTLVVELRMRQPPVDARARRAAAYEVIGAVAESRVLVTESPGATGWEVAIGVLDGDTDFAAHGHRLRLTLETEASDAAE